MHSDYFWRLAERCVSAARNCFECSAIEEFRALADEFARKAVELEGIDRMAIARPAHENGQRPGAQ